MLNLIASLYQKYGMESVLHTTLNPDGPGCVRIHLLPPKHVFSSAPSIALINGQDGIPLNRPWAILLSFFIEETNKYNGSPLFEKDFKDIIKRSARKANMIYPRIAVSKFEEDLKTILSVFIDVALGRTPDIKFDYLSISDLAKEMRAPHRMDIMLKGTSLYGRWDCNQKCLHCYASGQDLSGVRVLGKEEWFLVIDKLWESGVSTLTFTGGEPTLNPDLVEIVEYSKKFVTRLNTNGVLLTPKLCKELYDASLDAVQITYYSCEPEIHNKLVGANKYKATERAIENALDAGLNVSINTPLCSLNKDYVYTLAYLHHFGIRYVTCSSLIISGNALNNDSKVTQLSHDELFKILKDASEYCSEQGMELSFTSPGWLSKEELNSINLNNPTCGACLTNMAIAPNGDVVPCQSWLDSESSLGNILEIDFDKIWNSQKCKSHRDFSAIQPSLCPLRMINERNN